MASLPDLRLLHEKWLLLWVLLFLPLPWSLPFLRFPPRASAVKMFDLVFLCETVGGA